GGYGFSKEYEIERLYREAPMLLIGEGTAEIQGPTGAAAATASPRRYRATSSAYTMRFSTGWPRGSGSSPAHVTSRSAVLSVCP
ncbi:acyl-CoA dehydrogenase family protein, partial [Streptomyces sp. NPDC046261]|uniref:acyl-CoA dehydrogenase family protein n=1 Tax=Streptomyces sp. NPDC046261 TaxID=3157200 RepID=UPI0033CFC0D9